MTKFHATGLGGSPQTKNKKGQMQALLVDLA